jgi:predicted CopG family antitoxin
MKKIQATVTDEEYEVLKKKKGSRNWHDFIMLLQGYRGK